MSIKLPVDYIIQKFYQFAGYPKHNRHSHHYNASCPICREGGLYGKRKRLYYFPSENYLYCHKCGKSWSPTQWIIDVSGLSYKEIIKEIEQGNFEFTIPVEETKSKKESGVLPHDSINLSDKQQLEYYKHNKIVQDCLQFITDRRINVAINKPKTFYISLTDYIHKNRLCIPFFDYDGKIIFYQTRALYPKDEEKYPKYLSKLNGDKAVFGVNNIDINYDYLFIFEGPIDSMFVKNGIAVGGINLTNIQEKQLKRFKFFKKIWVPDCQHIDQAGLENTKFLLEQGENVFIWPKKYKNFKDINDICKKHELNSISPSFFIKNSHNTLAGLILLKS